MLLTGKESGWKTERITLYYIILATFLYSSLNKVHLRDKIHTTILCGSLSVSLCLPLCVFPPPTHKTVPFQISAYQKNIQPSSLRTLLHIE